MESHKEILYQDILDKEKVVHEAEVALRDALDWYIKQMTELNQLLSEQLIEE